VNVLVAYASKYGSTREIAEAIGTELATHGLDVDVGGVGDVDADDVPRYDAVVLGSAVYAGRWLEPARRFAERHGDMLADRPTWLFSSGPIGDPPRPDDADAVHVEHVLEATRATDHRVFAGKLDRSKLSFAERALVFAFRAEEGDFRDWEEIAGWACDIAETLAHSASHALAAA
jgi:menaquinone-dependent protoporphyrinogen oxidase